MTEQINTRSRRALALLFLVPALILGGMPTAAGQPHWYAVLRYCLAFVLLWVVPGLAWASLIARNAASRAALTALGLGLSFLVTPTAILLAAYLTGPLSMAQLLVVLGAGVLLPLGIGELRGLVQQGRRRSYTPPYNAVSASAEHHLMKTRDWVWLLIPLVIAGALRTIHLDYSQFQGDEAIVAVNAASALEGDDSAVFRLKKGPGELTVVAGTWRLTGILNEWMARIPFSWASLLGLIAVYLVCQHLERPSLGAVVVGLLAIDGYLLAFGRIVQYQSMVFALTSLGILCLSQYQETGKVSLLLSGAVLFAGGLLAHYDALLALPAGLLLVAGRWFAPALEHTRWRRAEAVRELLPLLIALLLGLALVALFFVPFLQSPFVERTSSYVARRLGSSLFNNLRSTFILSSVYNSTYYLALLLAALLVSLVTTWARWGRFGRSVGAGLLAAAVTAVFWPGGWAFGEAPWVWLPFALLLAGALLAPQQSVGQRAVWLWLAGPSLFYLFFVADPLTHVHTFFVPWAILAGVGILKVVRWIARFPAAVRWAAAVGGVALYLLCINYCVMVFVDHTPEYIRAFPASKSSLYWTPYQQIPTRGLFGFPYQAGWKVAGVQMEQGLLGETYASNEEAAITRYYMHQTLRWDCPTPDVYITAAQVQDEVRLRWDQIESDYQVMAVVMVAGQPRLKIHRRQVTSAPMALLPKKYTTVFDQGMTPDRVAWPLLQNAAPMPDEFTSLQVELGRIVRLNGYQLDTAEGYPGGYIDLTLLWETLGTNPVPADYTVFTHLENGQAMIGQLDGQPVCGRRPTSRWKPGQVVVDRYRIPIKNDAQPGPAELSVGMYEGGTLARLPVSLANGAVAGDSIRLAEVVILPRRQP